LRTLAPVHRNGGRWRSKGNRRPAEASLWHEQLSWRRWTWRTFESQQSPACACGLCEFVDFFSTRGADGARVSKVTGTLQRPLVR